MASAAQQSRLEKDSMGEVNVPQPAYYGAQTQRAIDNFPISQRRFPREFIRASGKTVRQTAQERKVLPEDWLQELLDPRRMTEPGLTAGPSGG